MIRDDNGELPSEFYTKIVRAASRSDTWVVMVVENGSIVLSLIETAAPSLNAVKESQR